MSDIKRFIESRLAMAPTPAFITLYRAEGDDQYVVCTVEASPTCHTEIEGALRRDLATVSGRVQYRLLPQDSSGAVLATHKLGYIGTAPKRAVDEAAGVNANLIKLVGELTDGSFEHFKYLFNQQDATIKALLTANTELSKALAEATERGFVPPNPMADAMGDRVKHMIDVGFGAAVGKLMGSGQPLNAANGAGRAVTTGKHAELRAFISRDLSDDEVDKILSLVLGANLGDAILSSLSEENLSKALKIMGGQ